MLALLLAAGSLLAWLGLLLLRARFWLARLPGPAPELSAWPQVVAIVPARDEAAVIDASLASLLRQHYPGAFHIILVDDHSADGTAEIARIAARPRRLEQRLTVIAARELPPGWTGKVWAQAEGVREQQSRFPCATWLLLTDADIMHDSASLRRLVSRAQAGGHVLVSEMVRLRCQSLAERTLVPAFVFFFAMLYPFALVNKPASRVAAAAGGCMLVRTDALAAAGGMAAIKNALIDDCALAARMKRHGPIRLDLAQSNRSLRACDGWGGIWNMIARSAYTQLGHSPLLLTATIASMLWLYLVPPLLALAGGAAAWLALPAWVLMTTIYVPMLRYHGRSPPWALALPLVALFYLGATIASALRYHRGKGGQWKGRAQAPVT
jgi:hopene-associated glycosyltransferase HpnB